MIYAPDRDRVRMDTASGPVWLDEAQTNQLLDIYQENDAKRAYLDLYEAGQAVGFIPRTTSFRSERDARAELAATLAKTRPTAA
jgi:hypothetical protein